MSDQTVVAAGTLEFSPEPGAGSPATSSSASPEATHSSPPTSASAASTTVESVKTREARSVWCWSVQSGELVRGLTRKNRTNAVSRKDIAGTDSQEHDIRSERAKAERRKGGREEGRKGHHETYIVEGVQRLGQRGEVRSQLDIRVLLQIVRWNQNSALGRSLSVVATQEDPSVCLGQGQRK